MRKATITRKTKETDITLELALLKENSKGKFEGTTGIGFFDHMLNSFFVHGGFDAKLSMNGDLFVDGHHTVEDVGIVIGMALKEIASDMKGIQRFSDIMLPMDETLVMCALDFSGRAFLHFDCDFLNEIIGAYNSQLTVEFMRALSTNAGVTLHINCMYGENDHHKTEAIYKAAGKCIGKALCIVSDDVLSTKGTL